MSEIKATSLAKIDSVPVSPFVYREYEYLCDNDKKSASFAEICKMSKMKQLQRTHMDILRLLLDYKFLSRFHLELLIGGAISKADDGGTITIESAISFMTRKGVILRSHFNVKDPSSSNVYIIPEGLELETAFPKNISEEQASGETDQELPNVDEKDDVEVTNNIDLTGQRSINFYMLSRGSLSFAYETFKGMIIGEADIKDYLKIPAPVEVLKTLSCNQFIIKCMKSASPGTLSYTTEIKVPATNIILSALFKKRVTTKNGVEEGKPMEFIEYALFNIRKYPDWEAEIKKSLEDYHTYLKGLHEKNELKVAPTIIFLCENDHHAIEVFKVVNSLPLNFMYTTDVRQYSNEFSKYVLKIGVMADAVTYSEIPSPLLSE